ncbi:SAM-dependent methyltransferase [Sphingorhabdus lutea]|uniref:SAM-dependent methyltransferase n=1 Tax=Sphingorhabdus lutea TaxID=1913578 RepID=A0A1L3J9W9_9SPHN|nr:class I SAM-dependent methyltransferase [Sphingorhabdus lutea]APG61910.1 SAM-dependent methyltransferase [Sphingorhabdus lutea]
MADLNFTTMIGQPRDDYTLIDSGHGRKFERYGKYHFIRPEAQALWAPALDHWDADGEFVPGADEDGGGQWQFDRPVPADGWPLNWNGIKFQARCTPFRHLGYFPDMDPVWQWMAQQLARRPENAEQAQVMNLFGYTGIGSLALSQTGAKVVHVDASKKSVAAARDNARMAAMDDRPIRWIIDDAAKFTAREVRRERHYDGILLDPPKYGRGPDGEIWRLEEDLPLLIENCRQLLSPQSSFLFLTVYAVRMSALSLGNMLNQHFADLGGKIEIGELVVKEESRGLLLPTAIFARWSRS